MPKDRIAAKALKEKLAMNIYDESDQARSKIEEFIKEDVAEGRYNTFAQMCLCLRTIQRRPAITRRGVSNQKEHGSSFAKKKACVSIT